MPSPEPFFEDAEYDQRMQAVRREMAKRELDGLLITSPENIYYLVGLSHHGYFAFTMLVLPLKGRPLLVARAMERVTISDQVTLAEHIGFGDADDPALTVGKTLQEIGLDTKRIGVEKDHMFFPPRIAEAIERSLPQAIWSDGSGIVDEVRLVKSPAEIAYTRRAAALSDVAMAAAIATADAGVNETEVVAEMYRQMILAGSEYPGFVPLVRSTETLGQEHGTWRDNLLRLGDAVFIEVSGCVRRYHAPMARVIYIDSAPKGIESTQEVVLEGLEAIRSSLRPGAVTGEVYAGWQRVIDRALGHNSYRRHHCGYTLGIGFPPSWVGGSVVVGIRPNGTMGIREGMVFHIVSWVIGSGLCEYGVTDTAIVTDSGAEILTSVPRTVTIK